MRLAGTLSTYKHTQLESKNKRTLQAQDPSRNFHHNMNVRTNTQKLSRPHLLILTQAVDRADPILGFFHEWIREFARRCEKVTVICLREGEHDLPDNVSVYSLGKTRNTKQTTISSRIRYVFRFYTLIWKLRYEYDTVFVHMNPEYILLGGMWWRLWGKYLMLWHNHPRASLMHAMAGRLAHIVFYTSPHAASAHFKHAVRMPAGIDTNLFAPTGVSRDRHAIYLQGRVAPSKRVHIAIEALRILRERMPATLTIVGPEDAQYGKDLRTRYDDLITDGIVTFVGAKRNTETPALYSAHGVAINLAAAGHFDKTVLEAMSCETPVVIGSAGFEGLIPPEWVVSQDDPVALAKTLEKLILLPEAEYKTLGRAERASVAATQSLFSLVESVMVYCINGKK